ncbi:hypothetical protein Emag_007546 [Eimeria magna]
MEVWDVDRFRQPPQQLKLATACRCSTAPTVLCKHWPNWSCYRRSGRDSAYTPDGTSNDKEAIVTLLNNKDFSCMKRKACQQEDLRRLWSELPGHIAGLQMEVATSTLGYTVQTKGEDRPADVRSSPKNPLKTIAVDSRPEGLDTQLRPDLILRDDTTRTIAIVDVATPCENFHENAFKEARMRKQEKYEELKRHYESRHPEWRWTPWCTDLLAALTRRTRSC